MVLVKIYFLLLDYQFRNRGMICPRWILNLANEKPYDPLVGTLVHLSTEFPTA